MEALSDEATLVVGGDFEEEAATVDFDEFAVAPDAHSDGGSGTMGDIDMGADRALAQFEIGREAFVAGLFDHGNHHGGCQDFDKTATNVCGGYLFGYHLFAVTFDSCGEHKRVGYLLLKITKLCKIYYQQYGYLGNSIFILISTVDLNETICIKKKVLLEDA